MEKAFALTKVNDDLKTDYASYFLKNDSNYCWESTRALEGEGPIPWTRFTELFLEKYFLDCLRNQMEMEFLELKQGDRNVTEYEAKFIELARIVPEYVSSEARRAKRAAKERGEKKRKFEGGPAKSEQEGSSQKFQRRFERNKDGKFRRQNFPQARPGTTSVSSTLTKSSKPVIDCKTYGKKHNGQCRENVNCFECGPKGHYSTECKSENPKVTSFSCGKVGHIARNCKSATQDSIGGSASQGPAKSTARARTFKND
ncbi:uncharacterized protein LOC141686943 [Apium graveolens]|uniref:uncharacterized protein LOC141686943 n=1 Tax=Apium graveolens TaxID=4045 RepID=UPI003D797AEC